MVETTIKPEWINTSSRLAQLIAALSVEPLVAVDTESDSLYSYFEKVCLIQFSTPTADYLVDPLAVNVAALGSIFAAPSIQKIFHAAEYDFLSLKRDYDFTFVNLFDTMVAARILGWSRYGLGALLEERFGVQLDKRFQRYNWAERPLSKKALTYAHLDTHYLISLRQIQVRELEKQNRLREATEAFERLTNVQPTPKLFDPDDFWRIKNAKELKPQQQAILRELFILRDQIAQKLDRPPFKVMSDGLLFELAQLQPQNQTELRRIKGIGEKLLHYNASDILQAIKRGQVNPPPRYPIYNHRPDDRTLTRYENLRRWRNHLAAERGVEPDVIMSNQALMSIARNNPRTIETLAQMGVLGEWQHQTYGQTLLEVLRNGSGVDLQPQQWE
jgi:ribonuclease D